MRFVPLVFFICLIASFSACMHTDECGQQPFQLNLSESNPRPDNSIFLVENNSVFEDEALIVNVDTPVISGSVFNATFDLDFDSTKMVFNGFVPGNVFEHGGQVVNYAVNLQSGNSNKLSVSVSLQGTAFGVLRSGTMVTLKFKAVAEGTTSLNFSNNQLLDFNGQVLTGLEWNNGTVSIFRGLCY